MKRRTLKLVGVRRDVRARIIKDIALAAVYWHTRGYDATSDSSDDKGEDHDAPQ